MEELAVERLHTSSIKPHGEKSHESGLFAVEDLADVDILITTAPILEFIKILKDKLGQIKIKKD
jgi:hypothetical protein